MFFIDYSLPWYSRYLLFLDAPFRYSWRHLIFYFQAKAIKKHTGESLLSPAERIAHFTIAFLQVIPFLGVVVALFDWLLFRRPLRLIRLESKEAIKVAETTFKECKAELHYIIYRVLPFYRSIITFRGKNPDLEAKKLEKYIPGRFIEEMKALSIISQIPYEEILLANTIIDMLDLFGCSICGVSRERETGQESHEFATNYFPSRGRGHSTIDVDQSFKRYDEMLAFFPGLSKRLLLKMLRRVNVRNTIHTVIADATLREIRLAVGSEYVANRRLKRFTAKKLFGNTKQIKGEFEALLARNLDWPMAFFAPLTRLFVRQGNSQYHSTVTINVPGLLGGYCGMNEHGLCYAASIVPATTQEGIPNQLLFRKVLEEAKSMREALKILEKCQPACSMNLILAAPDGIAHAELDPSRKKIGPSFVSFGI